MLAVNRADWPEYRLAAAGVTVTVGGPLTAPLTIGDSAWVCADVFVAPGVTIGTGAVAAARAVVVKNVAPWTVVGGNPAKFIKNRVLLEQAA